MIYIILSIIVIIISIIIIYNYQKNKIKISLIQKFEKELKQEYNIIEEGYKEKIKNLDEKLNIQSSLINEKINVIQQKKILLEQNLNELIKSEKEKVDVEVRSYLEAEMARARKGAEAARALAEEEMKEWLYNNNNIKEEKIIELNNIQEQIEDYRKKQDAINEEIRRRREVAEQQDFYRVVLTDAAKEDIQILKSIKQNLHFKENFDKLIYDMYVAKPTQEMTKRILKGKDPSGIYKITRLSTGEVYVGKSQTIATRWKSHIKTAMGVEAAARSMLHTTMEKDGIDNFTFELLEEVPKDQLSAREKYWIDFYQTKNYGLNERLG